MQYLSNQITEQLTAFAAISEPNAISPKAVADLLQSIADEVEAAFSSIYADANDLYVSSRLGCSLQEHFNTVYDHLAQHDDIVLRLKAAGLLPDQVTVSVPLSEGTFNETTKQIVWYAANGRLRLQQSKANSTTPVSGDYVAAPRLYKDHILLFEALNGCRIQRINIHYSGQYKGDSLIAGTTLDDTGANVVDDTTQVSRSFGTANDGVHTLAAISADGLQSIYLQNVATTVVQLRITQITITYVYPATNS